MDSTGESTGATAAIGSPAFWNHAASLLRVGDEGILAEFRAVRHGTLAEIIQFLLLLPEDERDGYLIEQTGSRRLTYAEASALASRPDFPR
ncbi:MAG: hypothetical protein WCY11_17875 [Novosphingobium sp.]